MNQYAIIFEEIEAGVYMDKAEDYEWCGDVSANESNIEPEEFVLV
jgi:hypothetical protein